jgi:hypothetical protein
LRSAPSRFSRLSPGSSLLPFRPTTSESMRGSK